MPAILLPQSFIQPRVPFDCNICCCCYTPQFGNTGSFAGGEMWREQLGVVLVSPRSTIEEWVETACADTRHLIQMNLSLLARKRQVPGRPPSLDNNRSILPMCTYAFPIMQIGTLRACEIFVDRSHTLRKPLKSLGISSLLAKEASSEQYTATKRPGEVSWYLEDL